MRLPAHVLAPSLGAVERIAVAFDREAAALDAFDDEVDPEPLGADLGLDPVASGGEPAHQVALELGLAGPGGVLAQGRPGRHRMVEMGDEPCLQVPRIELVERHRADQNEPVARPGGRDVEALLIAQHGQRGAPAPVRHHGQEHDVPFVALEGGAVAAQDRVALHCLLADPLPEHDPDQLGLVGTDERDDAERAPALGRVGRDGGDLLDR